MHTKMALRIRDGAWFDWAQSGDWPQAVPQDQVGIPSLSHESSQQKSGRGR